MYWDSRRRFRPDGLSMLQMISHAPHHLGFSPYRFDSFFKSAILISSSNEIWLLIWCDGKTRGSYWYQKLKGHRNPIFDPKSITAFHPRFFQLENYRKKGLPPNYNKRAIVIIHSTAYIFPVSPFSDLKFRLWVRVETRVVPKVEFNSTINLKSTISYTSCEIWTNMATSVKLAYLPIRGRGESSRLMLELTGTISWWRKLNG